jgi:hypothetical protein
MIETPSAVMTPSSRIWLATLLVAARRERFHV